LSLIDVCNRTCSFCPKSDEKVAPDTFQKMELVLIDKLVSDLKKTDFDAIRIKSLENPLWFIALAKKFNKNEIISKQYLRAF
jgi:hypothetical protein